MRPLKLEQLRELEQLEEGIIRLSHNKGGILGTKFHYVKPQEWDKRPAGIKADDRQQALDRARTRMGLDDMPDRFMPGTPGYKKNQKAGRIQAKIDHVRKGGRDVAAVKKHGMSAAQYRWTKARDEADRKASILGKIRIGLGRGVRGFMSPFQK